MSSPPANQDFKPDFERWSLYGYYNLRPFDPLQLSAGIAYDSLRFPRNYFAPPIAHGEDSTDQISPKAGFTYTPFRDTIIRFAYTRSLGGVSFDQSIRLEPIQVAGINQAFRSLIPESVAGTTPGAKFETFGLALEQKFPTRTYLTLQGDILNSDVRGTIGAVDLLFPPSFVPSTTSERLDFTEKNFTVTLNQLIGDYCSVGARYRLSDAHLNTRFPAIPTAVTALASQTDEATLHQLTLFGLVNAPCGGFARAEALWTAQDNQGSSGGLPGADFWQVNLFVGYRFLHRRAQAQFGVLNLADRDYRLNPLNLYAGLPRGREFTVNLQLNF